MIIAGVYSFKGGKEVVESQYAAQLSEIKQAIAAINPEEHRTKISKEKRCQGGCCIIRVL